MPKTALLLLPCLFLILAAGLADIRVNVNMTLVPVSVTDSYGRNVTGLSPADFRVYDSTQEVPIASFTRTDQPITVGLVFDCSGSMREKFRIAREAPGELFNQLSADDESFLVTVSTRAELRHPLTGDFGDLQSALLLPTPTERPRCWTVFIWRSSRPASRPIGKRRSWSFPMAARTTAVTVSGIWPGSPSSRTPRSSPPVSSKNRKARKKNWVLAC